MKIVLVGSPGSDCVIKASKYLTQKYLSGFDVTYLRYTGDILYWSEYLSGFFSYLTDEHVIFALDDYMVGDYIDKDKYELALSQIKDDVMNVKLCESTEKEHEEYPVTTQYTIWNREYLIRLLARTNSPWNFEIIGSLIFSGKALHIPCINYNTSSAVSVQRWEGVKLDGLKEEDIQYIKTHGLVTT